MSYSSDIDVVGGWLDDVIEEIGWDMPAADGDGTLGAAAIDVVADGMQARARVQRGPDGQPWDENEDDYAERKAALYGDRPPNFRTDQMLSRESLRGRSIVGHEQTDWTYGTGTPAPAGRTKHDREVTDTDKAWYANEEGQSEKKIKREFWGLDDRDPDDVVLAVEDAIAAHLERKAAST